MSSKSRNNPTPRKPQTKVDHVDGGQASLPSVEDFDEIVHVPEGKSRFQYLFLIGLLIFLLIIFIIPAAFQNVATGGSESGVLPGVTWETPEGGAYEMSYPDLIEAMRREEKFRRVLSGGSNSTPTPEEMATQLLLQELATEAGVYVSNESLATTIKPFVEQLGGRDRYIQFTLQNFGTKGTVAFEDYLRRGIRTERYLRLVGMLAAQPKPGDLEEQWVKDNVEYGFDYLAIKSEGFVDAAKAEAPDDDALQAWFDGRSDAEKNRFKTAQSWRLATAYVPIGEAAPNALLERYPLPEGFDTVKEGELFYNMHSYQAFKLEEPTLDDEGNEVKYQSLEDVRPLAEAAAQVKTAVTAWRADLKARTEAGEAVDLAAEAAELGITYVESMAARTREEIVADTMYGGGPVSSFLGTTQAGNLMNGAIVTPKVIEIVKVAETVEPQLKPFSEIRDDVIDLWAKERARDLALDFATALMSDTETMDADAFAALAEDERVELKARDWQTGRGWTGVMPDAEDTFGFFLLIQGETLGLYDMEAGAASEPTPNGDEVFVVRSRGTREQDFSKATPAEVEASRATLSQTLTVNFQKAFSSEDEDSLPEYLVKTYKLAVPESEAMNKRAAEERAKRKAEEGELPE